MKADTIKRAIFELDRAERLARKWASELAKDHRAPNQELRQKLEAEAQGCREALESLEKELENDLEVENPHHDGT